MDDGVVVGVVVVEIKEIRPYRLMKAFIMKILYDADDLVLVGLALVGADQPFSDGFLRGAEAYLAHRLFVHDDMAERVGYDMIKVEHPAGHHPHVQGPQEILVDMADLQ